MQGDFMIAQSLHRPEEDAEDYKLGDRLLYLRTPNFQGEDVRELQTALGALGFACGGVSGVFGVYTEGALRKFQLNMGLEDDGIAGVNTYATLKNLHNAWMDKPQIEDHAYIGFARAADVLEKHAVCLFGTEDFTRKVASYMSNLALATNPRSKVISADSLLVPPDGSMILAHIVLPLDKTESDVPRVLCDDPNTLSLRISGAIDIARSKASEGMPLRIVIEVKGPEMGATSDAVDQHAHHDAVLLLDAVCNAF